MSLMIADLMPTSRRSVRRSTLEFGTVLIAGFVLALLANSLSPRGISLTRDFFPPTPTAPSIPTAPSPTAEQATSAPKHEFRSVTLDDVRAIYGDRNYATRAFLLIDARDDAAYRLGHIPGAMQFDRYRPAGHIATVLPAARNAAKVVIYCHGGSCEDSIHTARMLIELGVNRNAIQIFDAGIESWKAANLPIQAIK